MKHRAFLSILAAALLLGTAAPAQAKDSRPGTRLGNNTEDITLITSGRNANQLAAIDGYDVVATPVPAQNPDKAPAAASHDSKGNQHTLFSVRQAGWAAFPSGIAYVPNEHVFVFGDQGDPGTLVVFDETGRQLAPRTVTPLSGLPDTIATEGITYMPSSSPFPDRIARAVWLRDFAPRIEIMRRDGTVEQEISLGLPPSAQYITGLTYLQGSNTFLVSSADPNLWEVRMDGSLVRGPLTLAGVGDVEGLAALADGTVYASGYTEGVMFALSPGSLAPAPGRDLPYNIGPGVSRSEDGVWDPTTKSFVMLNLDRAQTSPVISSVSKSLEEKSVLVRLPGITFGLTLAAGHTLATCRFESPAIDTYAFDGTPGPSLDLTTVAGLPHRRCDTLAYLSSIDAYAIQVRSRPDAHTVFVVSRTGTLLTSFPVGSSSFELTTAPLVGDRLLLWDGGATLFTYDVHGNLLRSDTPSTGSVVFPVGYIAGPEGSYGIQDPSDSELALFKP